MPDLKMLTHEYFESVDLTIYQPKKGFRYGPDSLALADLVHLQKSDVACELGAGSGVISCVVAKRDGPKKIVAVEIQNALYEIAKKNVRENKLDKIIEYVNADWRDFAKINRGVFDVVFSNPPFFTVKGRVSPDLKKAIARHEIAGTLDELLNSVRALLKQAGRFFIVFDNSRAHELKEKALNLGFKIVREVEKNTGHVTILLSLIMPVQPE